ncbi:hypothetical protein [Brevibacillus daliensis]|uniref:hypothetical protein n=1 Tax=Brevibacillus daliensis TaxID=2892995 RepID=UPI001E3DB675|nr:hypothetical protein [Brevibacillus daliensis]
MNSDKITQYLEQMAAQLGVAAEHVYDVLVRQQIASGIVDIVIATIVIYVLARTGRWIYANYEKTRNNWMSEWGFGLAIFILFGGFGGVSMLYVGATGFLHVLNPEYYAIREIMNVIGGAAR